jgi:hypothetical protein
LGTLTDVSLRLENVIALGNGFGEHLSCSKFAKLNQNGGIDLIVAFGGANMLNKRKEAFQRRLPIFSEDQAEKFFRNKGGEVVSVWGRRGAGDYLVLAFATETDELGPISLNRVAVEALRKILAQPAG